MGARRLREYRDGELFGVAPRYDAEVPGSFLSRDAVRQRAQWSHSVAGRPALAAAYLARREFSGTYGIGQKWLDPFVASEEYSRSGSFTRRGRRRRDLIGVQRDPS